MTTYSLRRLVPFLLGSAFVSSSVAQAQELRNGFLAPTTGIFAQIVGQFGQFKKAEFLKTPVYNRDYPPCKFCN